MQELFTQTGGFAGIVAIGIIIGGFMYIISNVRKNDMQILRSANTDLRDSITDNNTKISQLEMQVKLLESKVDILEKHNKTLEDLVVTALKQYFFENPKVASSFKDIITPITIDNT